MYLSPETILFIREHRNDDVHSLALQAKRYPQVDMPLAIVQIAGWQATVSKIPSWHATEGLLYPQPSIIRAMFIGSYRTLQSFTGTWRRVSRSEPADSALIVPFSLLSSKQSPI